MKEFKSKDGTNVIEFENNKLRDDLYECQGLLKDCQAELKQIEELLCTVE